MIAVENLIPVGSSRFSTNTGLWTSPLGSILSRSTAQVFSRTGYPSMQVVAAGSDDGAIQISNLRVPFNGNRGYKGFSLRAFMWVWTESSVEVEIYLTTQTASASAVATTSEFTKAQQWTLISVVSDPISDSETTSASVRADFKELGAGNAAFVSIPALVSPDAIRYNVASRETWIRLPEYIRNADINAEDPNLPLLRFTEVLTSIADEVDQTWDEYRYVPPEDNFGDALPSGLADPSIASESVLRWLAPLMGTQLINPFSGFTPWENLAAGADVNLDGTVTWDEFEDALDTDNDDEATWAEIENFNPSITGLDTFERWQITTAAYGLRGGTRASIESAAQQVLTGTKTVNVTPRFCGDPFSILVEVNNDEATDIGKVEEYIHPAVPAGFGAYVRRIIFTDEFTRADSASSAGGEWTPLSGTWGISSNAAYVVSATGGASSLLGYDTGAADHSITVNPTNTSGAGAFVRYADSNNYLWIQSAPTFGTWNVYKRVAGANTFVTNLGSIGATGPITIDVVGNKVYFTATLAKAGPTVVTLTDATLLTGTICGLYASSSISGTGTKWDNATVRAGIS